MEPFIYMLNKLFWPYFPNISSYFIFSCRTLSWFSDIMALFKVLTNRKLLISTVKIKWTYGEGKRDYLFSSYFYIYYSMNFNWLSPLYEMVRSCRSYDIAPPPCDVTSSHYPANDAKYAHIPDASIIKTESLKVRTSICVNYSSGNNINSSFYFVYLF